MPAQTKGPTGSMTALVTPMNSDGSVDYGALDALVEMQIQAGIDGLVPCGTTGESATMTAQERQDVIAHVVKKADGKVPVVAGAGANSTAVAIDHQKRAADTGAQWALVVTPFYNKPTPLGLYRHYEALVQAADIPVILYNVPGRTGCDMLPETVAKIAKLDGIVAVKEATADISRVQTIRDLTSTDFKILSGDDATTMDFMKAGGDGVISVASNVAPKEFTEMVHFTRDGELEKAQALHDQMAEIFDVLFIESNPIPVKTALAMKGMMQENFRLPLCEMSAETRVKLEAALKNGNWI